MSVDGGRQQPAPGMRFNSPPSSAVLPGSAQPTISVPEVPSALSFSIEEDIT